MGRAHEVRAASMAKTAAKKSAANGRAAKEIYMAAKNGGIDPNSNLTLRAVIEKAKSNQIPNDVVQRAIKRAQGGDVENYIANRYEALGPGGAALIIDVLTSNVNRAVANIREVLNKNHGNPEGKVAFLFKDVAIFAFENQNLETILEMLMSAEVEIDDVLEDDGIIFFYAPFKAYRDVKTALDNFGITKYLVAETKMIPIDEPLHLDETSKQQLQVLLDKLDEIEDVQNVYHNVEM